MSDDLVTYLDSVDSDLRRYLDAAQDLSLSAVEHLYRYAVALLQGLILPEHIAEDWKDFFCLVDAFVFAHGSKRLDFLTASALLLDAGGAQKSGKLTSSDLMFLVELVRELGDFVSARQSTAGGTSSER